ncbi:hypothetical protein ON010_g12278 [Phytophthora cinnamomi]|nr:hypothetical protein ON010_g12278 [Phytophthora cinnamomi]
MPAVEMASGYTAFDSPPAPTYRFVISSEAKKISIWLENLQSKQQWRTDYLGTKDYLTTKNIIPGATVADYVSVTDLDFNLQTEIITLNAMHYTLNNVADDVDKTKIRRNLIELEGNELNLELLVQIRALETAWSAKYIFLLKPISLDRIDIVEAKSRDWKTS